MISKFNKIIVLILLFTMLFVMLLPKTENATDYYKTNATLTSKSQLYAAENIGQTILAYNGHHSKEDKGSDGKAYNNASLALYRSADEMYCVEHLSESKTGDYKVKQYIRIEGNRAFKTKTGTTNYVQNNRNLALAYLLSQESYQKGDSTSNSGLVRKRAIHSYLCNGGQWYSVVGNQLSRGNWPSSWMRSYNSGDSTVTAFIKRANQYYNDENHKYPTTVKSDKSSLKVDTMTKLGPFKFTFNGSLKYIKLYNGNTQIPSNKVTFQVDGKNVPVGNIKSGSTFYILNSSGQKVTRVTAKNQTTVLTAEMWFLDMGNTAQKYMCTRTGTKAVEADNEVIITIIPNSGTIRIIKKDSRTNQPIKNTSEDMEAQFKIQTSSGWLKGTKGSYTYDDKTGSTYRTDRNGEIILEGLEKGTYTIKETKAPKNYTISTQSKNVTITDSRLNPSALVFYNEPDEPDELDEPDEPDEPNEGTEYGIVINKFDSATRKLISNSAATFVIRTSKGYLSGSEGSYKYDNSYSQAERYDVYGTRTFEGLEEGTYTAKEIQAPSRYLLSSKTERRTISSSNPTPSAMDFYNTPTGSLTVTKRDLKKNYVITDPTDFKIYRSGRGWLTDINTYTSSESNAKVYSTTNGKLYIDGLLYGTYTIKEVGAPKGYILAVQPTTSIDMKINSSNRDPKSDFKNLRKGSITIYKKDVENNQNIEGAGFKIKTPNGWLQGTQAPYTYNASYEGATIYRFKNEYSSEDNVIYPSENGLKIDGLDDGAYHIYEVEPPTGYLLKHQEGYDAEKGYADTKKEVTISSDNDIYDVNTTITNIKKVSIEGFIWEDTQATKDGAFNSLYDSSRESKISGVTVRLMKKGDNTPVGTATTDSEGKYLFDSLIKLSELEKYYVEFNYNDAVGKKYIPVAFNATAENGSKAMMKNVATKDDDLSGIATTYTGTSAIDTYGFMKCGTFDEPNLTVNNINLGIKEIPNADYTVNENLEYVKIVMRGYTYTYKYGSGGNSSSVAAPRVNFQKKGTISGYTADIYPSDIAYEAKNGKEELKVYVGYRIDITNTTTIGTGSAAKNYEELYQEQALNISSLVNEFDAKRYSLSENEKNWKVTNGDKAKANAQYTKGIESIGSYKTATKRIEFKVNRDAILDILNHPYGIIEEYPTKVTTIGNHNYVRYDYGWDYNIKSKNKQTHITSDTTMNADAPYLIFKLGQERILKGKVFEDKVVTTDGQKLGNGKYDNNENVVKGAKVELLDATGTETDITKLKVSNLYEAQGSGNTQRTVISKPAQVVTDQNGNYTLNGIVPGRYFLRFTYGDGTQKICDVSGKELKTIVAKDYKSTIVTNDAAKKALQGKEGEEWYKKITSENDSVAVDNLSVRKNVNEGKTQTAMAGTAKVSITIENDNTGTSSNVNQKDNGKVQEVQNLNTQVATTFNGLSFGIIVMPEQDSEIEKLITNVRLTNTSGQLLYDGNPENVPSEGIVALSDLDYEKNGGSTYVRTEMLENSLYGTNLELTYEVKITNKSDINYYNNEYYWFGDRNINKEVTLTPTLVKDYLDKTLTYLKEKSDKDRIIERNANSIIQVDGEELNAQELDLVGWKAIYTNKITNRDAKHPISDKVKIVANRLLSNTDDDMEVVSRAEIKGIIPTPDSNDSTPQAEKEEQVKIAPKEVHTNGMVKAKFTITPPTGENRSMITLYAIAGIMSLIILSTGIVIIKKKVL